MIDLRALADQVTDESTFVHFVAALADDWEDEQEKEAASRSSPYGPGANGWQNGTIGAFLGRAAAWAEDSRRAMPLREHPFRAPPAADNPWRRCAEILLAGKGYE